MINPFRNADAFDSIVLVGDPSPGLCEVSGAGRKYEWDIRKGHGLTGATVVYTGEGLAKFTVRFFVWDDMPPDGQLDIWDSWQAWWLRLDTSDKTKGLDISHPYLEELKIGAVVVDEEKQWTQADAGLFVKDIVFLQFRAPVAETGKPAGSKAGSGSGGSGGAQPSAQDEYDTMIEDMTKQVKELGK